jgi:hypothetical protein
MSLHRLTEDACYHLENGHTLDKRGRQDYMKIMLELLPVDSRLDPTEKSKQKKRQGRKHIGSMYAGPAVGFAIDT